MILAFARKTELPLFYALFKSSSMPSILPTICFALCWWLGFGHATHAAESQPESLLTEKELKELLDAYEQIKSGCNRSTTCIQDVVTKQFEPVPGESCNIKMQRAALLAYCNQLNDPIYQTSWFDLAGCDTNYVMLRYNLGLLHYYAKDYQEAQRHFLIAADLTPLMRTSCLTNAGSCAYNDSRMSEALSLFEQAYYVEKDPNVMLLNNLSALNITVKDYRKALEWAELAISVYSEMPEEDKSHFPAEFLQMVNHNQMKAAIRLKDIVLANRYWKKLNWDASWMLNRQAAKLIVDYVRLTGELSALQFQLERLGTLGIQSDSTYAYSDPLMVLILDSTTAALPAAERVAVWPELTRIFPLTRPDSSKTTESDPEAGIEFSNTAQILWGIALLLALVVNVILVAKLIRKVRRFLMTDSERRDVVLYAIRHQEITSELLLEAQPMFLTLYNSIQSHNHDITSADFNDTERIVFHEAIVGVYPKETAAKFDWSPAYVYSTRTRIRRKLDLPQEMTFRAWKALNPDLALSLFGTNEITDSKTNSDAD